MMKHAKAAGALAIGVLLSLTAAQAADGVVEVKLGQTIDRSWAQVTAAKFAYGPHQEYDAKTGRTHVYLPYGKDPSLYFEVRGNVYDAEGNQPAKFHSCTGEQNAVLTYKLHFDKPISAFAFRGQYAEIATQQDTAAGVEYSEDGETWKTLYQVGGGKSGIIEPFISHAEAKGLMASTITLGFRGSWGPELAIRIAIHPPSRSEQGAGSPRFPADHGHFLPILTKRPECQERTGATPPHETEHSLDFRVGGVFLRLPVRLFALGALHVSPPAASQGCRHMLQ